MSENGGKILLVEDDPNLGFIIQENLELQGFEVKLCSDGEAGKTAFLQERFDLCLIDVMLPLKDGFSLAREIREINQDIPVIFLTARSLKQDRIQGFKIGADDYVTKPFSMEELGLRIKAVLKRSKRLPGNTLENKIFAIGSFTFDYNRQLLHHKNKQQKLTHKESELLLLLCLHQNRVLDREMALELVWGEPSFFNARSMDVFITRLRKYFKEEDKIEIVNIHGKGFKLVVR